jgi:hypothetical protein
MNGGIVPLSKSVPYTPSQSSSLFLWRINNACGADYKKMRNSLEEKTRSLQQGQLSQTYIGAQPFSYSVADGGYFPGDKGGWM